MPGLSFIVLLLSICEIDLYEATTAAGDDMKLGKIFALFYIPVPVS